MAWGAVCFGTGLAQGATVPATTEGEIKSFFWTNLQFGSYSAEGVGTFEGDDYQLSASPFAGTGQGVSFSPSLSISANGAANVTFTPTTSALVSYEVHKLEQIEDLTLLGTTNTPLFASQYFGASHDVKLGAIETTAEFLYRFDFHGFEIRQSGAAVLTPWSPQPFGIDIPFFFDAQIPVDVTAYVDVWLEDLPGYGLAAPIPLLQGGVLSGASELSAALYGPALGLEPSIVSSPPGVPPGPERFLVPFSILDLGPLSLSGSLAAPVEIDAGDSPADLTFTGTAAWSLTLNGTGASVDNWSAAFLVPEPGGLALVASGLICLLMCLLHRSRVVAETR